MFKRITGKKCANPKCAAFQVVVDSALNVCEECADPLTAVTTLDRRAVVIAGAAAVVVLGGGGYFGALKVKAYLAARAVETVEQVSRPLTEVARAQVKALLQEIQTKGETADAKRRLDEFMRNYELGIEELDKLRREVQNEGSTTAAKVESDQSNKDLASLLRSVYADGIKTSDEQAEIERLSRSHAVDRDRLVQQEQEIKDRLNKSELSLKQGILYAAQRDYKQAAKEFRHSLDVDPENAFAWANLASAYLNENDHKSAREACDRALQLDARNWLAHYNLGSLYAKEGDKGRAIGELTAALGLVAEDQTNRITKAEIVSQMKADQALSALRSESRFQQLVSRK